MNSCKMCLTPPADPVVKEQSLSNSDNNMVSSGNTTARWNAGNGWKTRLTALCWDDLVSCLWVFCCYVWNQKTKHIRDSDEFQCWLIPVVTCPLVCPPALTHPRLLSFLHRGGSRRKFVTSTLYPVVTVTLDKCTVTMDQSNSDQLHTHRYVQTDSHTQQCKHTSISTHTHTHTRRHTHTHAHKHPPPLYQSVIGLSWFPVRQPDQWAWSCSPVVPSSGPRPPSSVSCRSTGTNF